MVSEIYALGGSYNLALIGTELVGKTLFARALQRHLRDKHGLSSYIVDEVVQSTPKPAQLASTTEVQDWILEAQAAIVRAIGLDFALLYGTNNRYARRIDVLLWDRGFLCNAKYWEFAASRFGVSEEERLRHFIEWGIAPTLRFTDLNILIHEFPASPEMMARARNGAVRQENLEWRHQMELMVCEGVELYRKLTADCRWAPEIVEVWSPLERLPNSEEEALWAVSEVEGRIIQTLEERVIPVLKRDGRL